MSILGILINEILCGCDSDDAPEEEVTPLGPILTKYDEIAGGGGDPREIAMRQVAFVRQQIKTNGLPFFKELRESRPILQAGPIWLVSRYADVEEILHRETVFSVQPYLPRMTGVIGPFVLSQDLTPAYDRDISLMRLALRREDLDRVAAIVTEEAEAMLSAQQGQPFDIVQKLTRIVPLRIAQRYMGYGRADDEALKKWARACFHEFFVNLDNDPQIRDAAMTAGAELRAHLEARMAKGAPADTVLGRLLDMRQAQSLGLTDEEILRTMMGLLVGMVETTSQASVHALLALMRRGQIEAAEAAARADDDDLLWRHISEALRFRPVNPLVVRHTTAAHRLGKGAEHETEIPKGAMVFCLTWSAMHDKRVVTAPETFRTDRAAEAYLHFAAGHHACFGRYVSEVQITRILKALLRRSARVTCDPVFAGPFPDQLFVKAVG